MNILYVSDSTTVSGAEVVLLGYLERYGPPEHRCHVLLHPTNLRLQRELDARSVPWTAANHYSRILLESRPDPRVLVHYAAALWSVARQMRRLIRDQGIDVIHSISYPASLYAALPALASGVPQVWHDHNIKRIHRLNRHLYRFVARSSCAVVGPSDAVTGNLARAGIPRDKLRTVYNGIDLDRFNVDDGQAAAVRRDLGIETGLLAVGLFGQMLPYKGHRTLIEAAPAILRRVPGARFFFVGALENPPYQAELQRRIDEAGLAAAFRFTGWRADIPAVLRAMDVLSVLTVTPEPAALGLMEAMAASRPVVATRTGGTPEIVTDGETGRIVPPEDAAATATAIASLLEDEALRARFGAAGRRRVERDFTRDAHLARMLHIYREGCAGSGSSPAARTSA